MKEINLKPFRRMNMLNSSAARLLFLTTLFLAFGAYPEAAAPVAGPSPAVAPSKGFTAPSTIKGDETSAAGSAATGTATAGSNPAVPKTIKPFRTFITLMRYTMENNGEPNNPISNVRIDVTFPNKSKLPLPDASQFWPIGNGQVQEINRTFEVPWAYIQNDGFKFDVQMVRKGTKFLPCQFDVVQLSQFNRSYVCHTDLNWQQSQKLAEENQDKEGIQVRIFTDLNSEPKEVPNDAIALK
jgi:hypothetical protein